MKYRFEITMIFLTLVMLVSMVSFIDVNSSKIPETSSEIASNQHVNSKMPENLLYENYDILSAPENSAVVFPIFTQSAYEWGGIHDYYQGYCDESCLTTNIESSYDQIYVTGGNAYRILEFLGYDIIDDLDIEKNPNILEKYDKVILLHNEFVTNNEFEAIINHPKVIYLYPNALHSEVKVNFDYTISLIEESHNLHKNTKNAFDWKFDNTEFFENNQCHNWNFYPINNGYMLNCYPEYIIINDISLLKTIKEL